MFPTKFFVKRKEVYSSRISSFTVKDGKTNLLVVKTRIKSPESRCIAREAGVGAGGGGEERRDEGIAP